MRLDVDYFRVLETPRLVQLGDNLVAAAFPMMKLMPARYILDRAERHGELQAGGRIVETTSGTFGMAVALLAAARGYRLTLVTAASLMDSAYIGRLEDLGATVAALDDPRGDGNQQGRLDYLQRVLASSPGCYWTRQYDSDGNWLAYARLAEQLIEAMGRIDILVGCIGTGGSLCGTGHFLRSIFPHLQIVAVDTHRSVLFGHQVGKRMLRGLGNSVLPKNVRHTLVDQIHWVGAYPAYHSCHDLLRRHGVFAGPTSGAAVEVGKWVASTNRDARVAAIMPDEGHRHAATVFSRDWLAALPGWNANIASTPRRTETIAAEGEGDWSYFDWSRRELAQVLQSQPG